MATLDGVRARIPVGDAEIVPPPAFFRHRSHLHGPAHVARVMVHAFRLVAATGLLDETARLWASVYLHDLARVHDGRSRRHGAAAWDRFARLKDLPGVAELFERGGVRREDYPAIQQAVTLHSNGEPSAEDPHRQLVCLLKDADGLDRVRLGDLNSDYLRFAESRGMVEFAQLLLQATDRQRPQEGPYFEWVWGRAKRAGEAGPSR
jgi:hypothetical protein